MFIPTDSDIRFSVPSTVEGGAICVAGNREKTLFAVLSPSTVYIYQANPQIVLCTFRRDDDEVVDRGKYARCIWRHDSKAICVLTDNHCLYVYAVEVSDDQEPFNLQGRESTTNAITSPEAYFMRQKHPVVRVWLTVVARIGSVATCVTSLKDDLFVCLQDGWIHRITWVGEVRQELSFNIRIVPFSNDQLNSNFSKISDATVHVVDIVYCPLVGGLCVVLSDGRAALLSSQSRFEPASIVGIWMTGLKDAVCCSANHKFRLLYFGCQNGEIAAYNVDEDANGAMIRTFRIQLSIKDGQEHLSRISSVRQVQCLPQGLVFAVVWSSQPPLTPEERHLPPVIGLFSPFGAQWWSSLEDASDRLCSAPADTVAVEWGAEGFQLWTVSPDTGLGLIRLCRSLSVGQPSTECLDRIALLTASSVMVAPAGEREKLATAPHCYWNVYTPPDDYISLNWPLRFAALDDDCSRALVVAGSRGFAFHNLKSGKWRLFRNEHQEQALFVTGGVAVFQDHVIAVGCDFNAEEEGIFIYSTQNQIDHATATKYSIPNRVMFINLRNDHMLTFDVASVITIYVFRQVSGPDNTLTCNVQRCAEIRIHELLPHPTCVISTQLTALNYHSEATAFCHGMDSLLVNISGNLYLLFPFQRESSGSREGKGGRMSPREDAINSSGPPEGDDVFQLHVPMQIASNVERVWIHVGNRQVPHLNKAVWINAGVNSMKVWLPLFHTDAYEGLGSRTNLSSTRTFISKRIMLPIDLSLYTIAIGQDCLAYGVESLPTAITRDSDAKPIVLVHNVIRSSEVFVHRLLRQLLKRNLGVYALEIASSCRQLPYFSHILELLLHDVLDEEATSKVPLPDPLLPRIVAFIHEFPEYLETIVHCTRKTELAFWKVLFAVSHHPRDLFRMCLKEDQLDTATSCLIILQVTESTVASVQHATILLEEALNKRRWLIARDIVRFLNSIDSNDLDETPDSPMLLKLTTKGTKQPRVLPNAASDDYNIVLNSISVETHGPVRPRHSLSQQSSGHSPNVPTSLDLSATATAVGSGLRSPTGDGSSFLHSFNTFNLSSGSGSMMPAGRILIPDHLAHILSNHAGVLVEDFALRDLAAFASHLTFDLVDFMLRTQGSFTAPASEFPLIIMKLHSQFKWPYPVVGDVVDKLIERITAGDLTPSASEDESATPGKVSRRRSSSRPSFDWKVFEKLCVRSASSKGVAQASEPEVNYLIDWLSRGQALEWIYLLSLMHRDLSPIHDIIEGNQLEKRRVALFLRRVTEGTQVLLQWARDSCPAYVSILKLCANFLEHASDQLKLRRFSHQPATTNGTAHKQNGTVPTGHSD